MLCALWVESILKGDQPSWCRWAFARIVTSPYSRGWFGDGTNSLVWLMRLCSVKSQFSLGLNRQIAFRLQSMMYASISILICVGWSTFDPRLLMSPYAGAIAWGYAGSQGLWISPDLSRSRMLVGTKHLAIRHVFWKTKILQLQSRGWNKSAPSPTTVRKRMLREMDLGTKSCGGLIDQQSFNDCAAGIWATTTSAGGNTSNCVSRRQPYDRLFYYLSYLYCKRSGAETLHHFCRNACRRVHWSYELVRSYRSGLHISMMSWSYFERRYLAHIS